MISRNFSVGAVGSEGIEIAIPHIAEMSVEINVSFVDMFKLACSYLKHKFVQYNLGTNQTAVLNTNYGLVKGLLRKTIYDEELYYAFEGIPFAKPPLGELRFRAPQPPEPWEGIRDCTYPRAKPLQMHSILHIAHGSEDCLYLNVYAKKLISEKRLPVMVWIYSGGFQVGEASRETHGPDYFMKKDVVLITFNHRLGALGFLSLSDPDLNVPGNAGIKDQVLALRWVHENISNFNGDPNNITLMGMSSGAASTEILMNTEQTRGLFHKAILMSGSSLCDWVYNGISHWPHRFASLLGYNGSSDDKEVIRFLQGVSSRRMALSHSIANQQEKREYIVSPFGPTVEPYITESCVISKPILETLSKRWGNEIPVIIGGTSFEGLFSYQFLQRDSKHLLSDFGALIPREVRAACSANELEEHVRRLKLHSFKDVSRNRMEFDECLQLLSLKHFRHAVHRSTLARLAYAPTAPTYLYRFDFDSPTFSVFRRLLCGPNQRGAAHVDDLFYIFHGVLSCKLDQNSEEYQTIENMINMWVAFATHGNPNYAPIAPIEWKPLEANTPLMCLNIGKRMEFIELPETKQLELWDSFYDKVNLY